MEFFEWRDAPEAEFAVVGDPIGHSWSPKMFRAAFQALGVPYRYVAIRVEKGDFGTAMPHLAERGYRGLNVTLPLKGEAAEVLKAGVAINTVRLADRVGISTDGPGLIAALAYSGIRPSARVLILGAGGTTRSILGPLVEAGFRVSLWSRTRSRIDEVIRQTGVPCDTLERAETADFEVVINATSASLNGDALPIEWGGTGLAMDLMYDHEPTLFMREAQVVGWDAVDGRGLLVQQGALSFEFWLGVKPSIDAMREALT